MKTIVCIFAHPDDEAFGPGGTIAKLAQKNKVYIICATKGEAGKDSRKEKRGKLYDHRAKELLASAKILGVKKVFFLGFKDGTLSNNLYHAVAGKIEKILKRLKPEMILTHEPGGGSGHLDHIAISMISSYVVEQMPFIKTILQHCIPDFRARRMGKYFIYRPPGYSLKDIDLIVDVEDVWEMKLKAMQQHQSQKHDVERILKFSRQFPKKEYFLVKQKGKGVGKIGGVLSFFNRLGLLTQQEGTRLGKRN